MKNFFYFYIVIFIIFCCGETYDDSKYMIYLPDIKNEDSVECSDLAYFESKLWYVKFKKTEPIKLNDGQIFYADEIWYAKEKETLLKLINNSTYGYPFTLPDETNSQMIRDIHFKEDKNIHYVYIINNNYYKIYLDNGDTILAKKVSIHDPINITSAKRDEYKISEINDIISGQKFRIPYPKPNGQNVEAIEIHFHYDGYLDNIYLNKFGIDIPLPNKNDMAKVNFISFYPTGDIKRINLTKSTTITIDNNPKIVSEYIIYNEDGTIGWAK